MASSLITSCKWKSGISDRFYFLGFQNFCGRGRLVLFLSLGEVALYKRGPMQSSSELPFITEERARGLLVSG